MNSFNWIHELISDALYASLIDMKYWKNSIGYIWWKSVQFSLAATWITWERVDTKKFNKSFLLPPKFEFFLDMDIKRWIRPEKCLSILCLVLASFVLNLSVLQIERAFDQKIYWQKISKNAQAYFCPKTSFLFLFLTDDSNFWPTYVLEFRFLFWAIQVSLKVITLPQLNDRVFVDNEGVSSLSYQEGDKFHPFASNYDETQRLPAIVRVSDVKIKNGKIGRSSHAGIHGNGATNIRIVDVEIFDFEVWIFHQ